MGRSATVQRKTGESDISFSLDLDGTGQGDIQTGVGFLDHMLELLARHGLFDLEVQGSRRSARRPASHTVEDVGICLGQPLRQSLGDMAGIPMMLRPAGFGTAGPAALCWGRYTQANRRRISRRVKGRTIRLVQDEIAEVGMRNNEGRDIANSETRK